MNCKNSCLRHPVDRVCKVRTFGLFLILISSSAQLAFGQTVERIFPLDYAISVHQFDSRLQLAGVDVLRDTALLVWSTLDSGRADDVAILYGQYFVNKVPDGGPFRITSQEARPYNPGLQSLAVAACGAEFLVFWNDERSSRSRHYMVRIGRDRTVHGPEIVLSSGAERYYSNRYGNPDSGRVLRFGSLLLSFDSAGREQRDPVYLSSDPVRDILVPVWGNMSVLTMSDGTSVLIDGFHSQVSDRPVPLYRLHGNFFPQKNGGLLTYSRDTILDYYSVYDTLPQYRQFMTIPKALRDTVLIINRVKTGAYNALVMKKLKVDNSTSTNVVPFIYRIESDTALRVASDYGPLLEDHITCKDSLVDYTVLYGCDSLLYARMVKRQYLNCQLTRVDTICYRMSTEQKSIAGGCAISNCTKLQVGAVASVVQFDSVSRVSLRFLGDKNSVTISLPTRRNAQLDSVLIPHVRNDIELFTRQGRPMLLSESDIFRLDRNAIPIIIPKTFGVPGIPKEFFPWYYTSYHRYATLEEEEWQSLVRDENVVLLIGAWYDYAAYEWVATNTSTMHTTFTLKRSYEIIPDSSSYRVAGNDNLDYFYFAEDVGPSNSRIPTKTPSTFMWEPNSRTLVAQFNYEPIDQIGTKFKDNSGYHTGFIPDATTATFTLPGIGGTTCCQLYVPIDGRSYLGSVRSGPSLTLYLNDSSGSYRVGSLAPIEKGSIRRLLGNTYLEYGPTQASTVELRLYALYDRLLQRITLELPPHERVRMVQSPKDSSVGLYYRTDQGIRADFLRKDLTLAVSDTFMVRSPFIQDFDVLPLGDSIVIGWVSSEGSPDLYWTWIPQPEIGNALSSIPTQSNVDSRTPLVSRIYPNPAATSIRIEFFDERDYEYRFYDANGRGVDLSTSEKWMRDRLELDVSGIASGWYRLVVKSPNGEKEEKSLLIVR